MKEDGTRTKRRHVAKGLRKAGGAFKLINDLAREKLLDLECCGRVVESRFARVGRPCQDSERSHHLIVRLKNQLVVTDHNKSLTVALCQRTHACKDAGSSGEVEINWKQERIKKAISLKMEKRDKPCSAALTHMRRRRSYGMTTYGTTTRLKKFFFSYVFFVYSNCVSLFISAVKSWQWNIGSGNIEQWNIGSGNLGSGILAKEEEQYSQLNKTTSTPNLSTQSQSQANTTHTLIVSKDGLYCNGHNSHAGWDAL